MNRARVAVISGMLAWTGGVCANDVVFNSFGPGNSFDPLSSLAIRGSQAASGPGASAAFMVELPAAWVRQLDLALNHIAGPDGFTVSMHEGDATGIGALLWSETFVAGSASAPVTVVLNPNAVVPNLIQGHTYWFVVSAAGEAGVGEWHLNDQNILGTVAQREWDAGLGQWGSWVISTDSSLPAARVSVMACYAHCDTFTPWPTVDDFICFINEFAFATGLPHEEQITHYANCDGSTTEPVLTVDDFTCFVDAFARGCP